MQSVHSIQTNRPNTELIFLSVKMKDYEVIFARNLLHVLVRYRIVKNKNSAVCGGPPFKKSKY